MADRQCQQQGLGETGETVEVASNKRLHQTAIAAAELRVKLYGPEIASSGILSNSTLCIEFYLSSMLKP